MKVNSGKRKKCVWRSQFINFNIEELEVADEFRYLEEICEDYARKAQGIVFQKKKKLGIHCKL